MPRKTFRANKVIPYHISARCINREWFRIPLPQVWEIFSDQLHFMHHAFDVGITSFVLMPNHFHLIASTPKGNLDRAMNYFMRETSRAVSKKSKRINQVYGGPYHWSLVDNQRYFYHAYKYVYRNPADAGLIGRVEDYPFSTIHGLLGRSHLTIPTLEDTLLFGSNVELFLSWLNRNYEKEHRNQIRAALKKEYFKFALERNPRRPTLLESQIL